MEDFNSQFNLVCKTFPNVYGTGKYCYNKKYQLKTRMEDLNDNSDMKRYFQAMCDSIQDRKSLISEIVDYSNRIKRLNIKIAELEELCKNPSTSEMDWKLKDANESAARYKEQLDRCISKNAKNRILCTVNNILIDYDFENLSELIKYLDSNLKSPS